MTTILRRALFAALAALALAAPAQASEKVTVTNSAKNPVRFFWTANGCAGIKDGRTRVCHHETIQAGKEGSYTFKWGTTGRFVKPLDLSCDDGVDYGREVKKTSIGYLGCSTWN